MMSRNLKPLPLSLTGNSLLGILGTFPSFKTFDQIANKCFKEDFSSSFDFHPATDISETKDCYLLRADLPGVEEKDIHIQMEDDNSLSIQGQRLLENLEKEEGDSHIERSYGAFKRLFYLSSHIDKENIQARYENGVLEILIPKKKKGNPIKIETNKEKAQGLFQKYFGKKKPELSRASLP